jgi:dCMP deaminase
MENNNQLKWDLRFLELAQFVSKWSKDPSTQTGAVIVDKNRRVVSVGYNGFAKGVQDLEERYKDRDFKIATIIHCEENAILFSRQDLTCCTLYTHPFCSCAKCASLVIQSGISRCVAQPLPEHLQGRWGANVEITKQMFQEAGVELLFLN